MSSSGDALGGRLPLAERSALSEPQQQLYDRMTESVVPWGEHAGFATQTSDGRFIGPFNPALQSPVISGSFLYLGFHVVVPERRKRGIVPIFVVTVAFIAALSRVRP